METYNSIGLSDEEYAEKLNASYKYLLNKVGYEVQNYPANLPPFEDHEVEGFNLVSETVRIRGYFNSGRTTATGHTTYASGDINTFRNYVKIEKLTGGDPVYPCLVRYELNYKFRYDETYTGEDKDTIMLFMCNRSDGLNFTEYPYSDETYHYQASPRWYDNVWDTYADAGLRVRGDRNPYDRFSTLSGVINNIKTVYPLTTDYTAHLDALNNAFSGVYVSSIGQPNRDQKFMCGVPYAYMDTNGYHYTSRIKEIPDWLPCFDGKDVSAIIAYLRTGDASGSYDPFTPPYPEVTEITNYHTDQKLYISQNSKLNNKYSYEFLNSDYNLLDQVNRDQYACYVYYNHSTSEKHTSQPAPVVTINEDITTTNDDYIAISYLGWVDQTAEDAQTSGAFKVWYTYKKNSNVGIAVNKVEWLEHPYDLGGEPCPHTVLDNGNLVYTSPTSGETLTIIYRAINMDDIKADFTDDEDKEDDTTGTDVTIPTGRGIGTFLISESQLSAINAKLWSYDWAQFFKSSTINPVQCVISCKSIPFAAEASGSEEIVIANMFTDVSASRVNPSFRSGTAATLSVTMPSYNGDFTDIEHVRVHCYLPYIGWVDLPASEVISRRAKLNVGLSANTKILTFRYLADLIDGTCTCVIAVNGTERWKFDGVCGVDIPVTSDNHTNAINNAMHAGLQTALSLGSAVVGGLTGNGMMSAGGVVSAISNVPNAIPTYSYSASASPSGYINAAMNTHVMLVIERPNVKYDANTVKRLGKPCHKVLSLGSLRGFTKCGSVRLEGIDATPEELALIAAGLERGVIL